MGVIGVSHLKLDALLCNDVKDCNGRLLVSSGTRLTEKHIRIIKIWGITEVEVEDTAAEKDLDPSSVQAIDPERLVAAEATVRNRFRFCDMGCPATAELFRLARQRLAGQVSPDGPKRESPQESAFCRRSSVSGNDL